ncbi:dna repair rad52-like protein 2 [Quercus suber]|uniref:Dna repair rad52-like protein 2 n=1 Tax=Quercus suber TaxID=58331 RepID=A0AAW0KQG2_QUESU
MAVQSITTTTTNPFLTKSATLDLNKRIPDNIIKSSDDDHTSFATFIPWYHANRMLSFYAPGWCGEIRDVIFSDNGGVTVVYRVTIRGSDGESVCPVWPWLVSLSQRIDVTDGKEVDIPVMENDATTY